MNVRLIGIGLFVAAAGAIVVSTQVDWQTIGGAPWDAEACPGRPVVEGQDPQAPEAVDVAGFIGGEKRHFLANPRVQQVLLDCYGITLDARRAGSLAMVRDPELIGQNPDFYWPSSQVALELARDNGLAPVETEIVFNSPIVLYSWAPIADALVSRNIAAPVDGRGNAYTLDMAAFLDLVQTRTSWSDLGIGAYGSILFTSTDPNLSNSGNQFASLVTMVLADQRSEGPAFRGAVDEVAAMYERIGFMEGSSSTLFEQYLRQGLGAYPLAAGYENQLVEFAIADTEQWQSLEGRDIRPVVLYPEPTVYSSHVVLAMTDAGRRFIDAMQDRELQDIAWAQHGFRSGFAASQDPSALPVSGIPESVGQIVPMPPVAAVTAILTAIGDDKPSTP